MKSVALVAMLLFVASSANASWTPTPILGCGKGEVFSGCHSYCERTCTTPAFTMCQAACKVGCGCKKGYVRDKKGGECIPKMLCGVVPMKSADEDDDLGYARNNAPFNTFADEDDELGYARNNAPFNTFADEDDDLGYARNNAPFNIFARRRLSWVKKT
jgi:hypothetical protein